jgi:hypothetical protein
MGGPDWRFGGRVVGTGTWRGGWLGDGSIKVGSSALEDIDKGEGWIKARRGKARKDGGGFDGYTGWKGRVVGCEDGDIVRL